MRSVSRLRFSARPRSSWTSGPNFGVFTVILSRLAPQAKIFAFEPNPATASALRANLKRNDVENATIIESAVGSEDRTIRFTNTSDPATNRIVQSDASGIEVPICTLDTFCRNNGIDRVDFLKIDVEGAEPMVLTGARGLFNRRAIASGMIEICPGNLKQFKYSTTDLSAFFVQAGYDLSLLEADTGTVIDDGLTLENAGFVPASAPYARADQILAPVYLAGL